MTQTSEGDNEVPDATTEEVVESVLYDDPDTSVSKYGTKKVATAMAQVAKVAAIFDANRIRPQGTNSKK